MRGRDEPAQLTASRGGHRVAQRPGDREPHAAEVQQRGVDLEALGHLRDAVVEHGVAGDPQRAVLLAVPRQREADRRADERAAAAAGRAGTASR